jgi:dTDP-4-amino-4,6-dideoxygalactose transaminase
MKLSYPNYNQKTIKKVQQVLNLEKLIIGLAMSVKILKKNFLIILNKYSVAVSNGSVALELH